MVQSVSFERDIISLPNDSVEPSPVDLLSDFTDYDYALYSVLDGGVDYIAQISEVSDLWNRQRETAQSLQAKIIEADAFARRTTGTLNYLAVEDYIHHVHSSVYQDAAHSMAAVGMLAPLIESIFDQSFVGIRRLAEESMVAISTSHPRWQPTIYRWNRHKWDCHFFLDGNRWRKGLIKGILELAEAVGLSTYMPSDLEPVLQALFEYRNKMFHCGFEWPLVERERFERKRASWPSDWFSLAVTGQEPWIFYLTDAFIEHCLDIVHGVLVGIGAFARIQRTAHVAV